MSSGKCWPLGVLSGYRGDWRRAWVGVLVGLLLSTMMSSASANTVFGWSDDINIYSGNGPIAPGTWLQADFADAGLDKVTLDANHELSVGKPAGYRSN